MTRKKDCPYRFTVRSTPLGKAGFRRTGLHVWIKGSRGGLPRVILTVYMWTQRPYWQFYIMRRANKRSWWEQQGRSPRLRSLNKAYAWYIAQRLMGKLP